MPRLFVIADDGVRETPFSPGSSVREILDAAGLRVRTGCRGNGACGLCLVQVEAGSIHSATNNERLLLAPEQLERSLRLACQLMPEDDLRLHIVNPAPISRWRALAWDYLPCTPPRLHALADVQSREAAYGLAVDLGTTHISLCLWDLKKGHRLSGRTGPNPQSHHGTDVVTRLMAAGESPSKARELARMPLEAVGEALRDMCSREGLSPREVLGVTLVGNTPMLALLTETDPQTLLQPRSWTQPRDCRPEDARTWVRILGIHPEATVEVVSPVAGLVGSDLLAGVLATHLTDHPGGLLVDFGTNSEMALWDGNRLWVTSAAGGPAFESCDMQCGMPAEPGAIYRVDRQQDSAGLRLHVLGGGEAVGLCGSGLVDLIALLLSAGALTRLGKFAMEHPEDGFVLRRNGSILRLSGRDVDTFQRAKAAIGVGIRTLLARAHMSTAELSRVCVGGVFGQHLNVGNAQRVGLLPDISPERVEVCGNTALAGGERLLLSPRRVEDLAPLRRRAAIINLSQESEFETLFLENLYLQPLKVEES